MTTNSKESSINWSIIQPFLFLVGCVIACIPLFSMDYLITLDGPNHLYSSKIFTHLLSGDPFYSKYFHLNESFTPNYFTVIVLGGLQNLFSGVVTLKIFHILHITLLISGAFFWSNSNSDKNKHYPFLVLPFIYSYLFFSGFYNFIFAVSISLWLLGLYDRFSKIKWNWKHYVVIGLLLFLTYSSHIIPFFFAGIYIAVDLLNTWKQNSWDKSYLYHCLLIFFCALPEVLLTTLFMGSRESSYSYLELSELVSHISSGFSIVIKNDTPEELLHINWIKLGFLAFSLMLFLFTVFNQKQGKQYVLGISSFAILACYFIFPDSTGYASVFSVRIEYIFWIFIAIGASRLATKIQYSFLLLAAVGIGLLIFQLQANLPYWKMLNGHAKSVVSAVDHIENNATVYPVFNSLIWDDYHISNLLGTSSKDLLILENTSARQDYFPLIYNAPYESCMTEQISDNLNCSGQSIHVDYLLIVGKYVLDPSDKVAIELYSKAHNQGQVIFEDDFVQLLKFP